MGHSVHSYYTRNNQPYVYGDYSIFLAEIASTTNENILTEYLLQTETDPKVRAYVLNHYLDGFKEPFSVKRNLRNLNILFTRKMLKARH